MSPIQYCAFATPCFANGRSSLQAVTKSPFLYASSPAAMSAGNGSAPKTSRSASRQNEGRASHWKFTISGLLYGHPATRAEVSRGLTAPSRDGGPRDLVSEPEHLSRFLMGEGQTAYRGER